MKYVAKDGKEFSNALECMKYENSLDSDKFEERDKDFKELMDKKKAVESAEREYEEAKEAYNNKYGKQSPALSFFDYLILSQLI